jgi:hypothetical protein
LPRLVEEVYNAKRPAFLGRSDTMAEDPPHALRLTLAYRGKQVSIAGSQRVEMIVPASIEASPDTTGYSFALLDANGRVIYQRPLHAPIRTDAEAYSPRKGDAIERVPLATSEGRFTVLVPDLANAHAFRLSGPADPKRPDEPATELLRADIDALRKAASVPSGPPGAPPRQGPGR